MGPAATRLDQKKSTLSFPKTSGLCEAGDGHFEHNAKMDYLLDFGIGNNSQCFLTMKRNCSRISPI